MDRVRFETHKGKQILFIDCRDCVPEEMLLILDRVRDVVTSQPPASTLTLSDFTGAQVNRDVITRIKEVAAYDRPYVRRAALIGLGKLSSVLQTGMEAFSAREFPAFGTREEAIAYLLDDEATERRSA